MKITEITSTHHPSFHLFVLSHLFSTPNISRPLDPFALLPIQLGEKKSPIIELVNDNPLLSIYQENLPHGIDDQIPSHTHEDSPLIESHCFMLVLFKIMLVF